MLARRFSAGPFERAGITRRRRLTPSPKG